MKLDSHIAIHVCVLLNCVFAYFSMTSNACLYVVRAMYHWFNQGKQNLFKFDWETWIQQNIFFTLYKVHMYGWYTSIHLPVIAITLNECTCKLESSLDTSALGLYTQYEWQHMKAGCAHTYTHPLSICHAYPPCAYKTLSSSFLTVQYSYSLRVYTNSNN